MAVERWLYGNANYEDSRLQEFQPRLYDSGLKDLRDDLIELSRRMIASTCRKGEYRSEMCWFAGYIDAQRYAVALAGEQNRLLGTQYRGSRGLFCMMALVFSGADIGLYRQDEGLFEPLKALMRQVNEIGYAQCDSAFSETEWMAHCRRYRMTAMDTPRVGGDNNILHADKAVHDALWQQSLHCPAALNILSKEDAEKLIDRFPGWRVTVTENVQEKYRPVARLSVVERRMQQEAQRRQELERLEKQKETALNQANEQRGAEEEKASARSAMNPIWIRAALIAAIVLLMFMLFGNGNRGHQEAVRGTEESVGCLDGEGRYTYRICFIHEGASV